MALPGGGIEHIRIAGVHYHFGYANPFIIPQDFLPCFPAISCFIQSSFIAFIPERALGSDPENV